MDEVKNLTYEEVMEIIKDFPVKPRRNRAIITVNAMESEDGIMLSNGGFSETQYVIAKGDNITDLTPGDKVLIDIEKMMVFNEAQDNSHEKVGMIKINPIEVDGHIFALISEGVIIAVDGRYNR